jgi:hypothetical protein
MAKVKLPEALVESRAAKARTSAQETTPGQIDGLQGRLDLVHGLVPAQQDRVFLRVRVALALVQQNGRIATLQNFYE